MPPIWVCSAVGVTALVFSRKCQWIADFLACATHASVSPGNPLFEDHVFLEVCFMSLVRRAAAIVLYSARLLEPHIATRRIVSNCLSTFTATGNTGYAASRIAHSIPLGFGPVLPAAHTFAPTLMPIAA
jgi:hypothetical protein